ncbi:GNAT family N-acetyltransferase [Bacillus sp. FJAT-45037]|uniref:GNAT family N-acetyltransferase n=1 Tax=Bacillus sp. FJAT-45037 TaxID=2011007 RepID=UPI000C240871|nr:GNAT family N-acetyltransferase [Bacillus sp. FJAT-45037]
MLIPYKTSQKKIAMGLLSYMPKEKDVKQLMHTIERYETESNWSLFFWREEDDLVGIAGFEKREDKVILHHLSVIPSYRKEGIGTRILQAIQAKFDLPLVPSKATKDFVENCNE